MKAEELMVNDWIYCPEVNVRVGEIKRERVECYEPHRIGCELCRTEPIPLTEEILSANGFVEGEEYQEKVFFVNEKYGIKSYPKKWSMPYKWYLTIRNGDIPVAKVDSVHELQRALRVIGLTDKANNFRIA